MTAFKTPHFLLGQQIDIVVVGCGGTGGYLLSLLAQMNYVLTQISEGETSLHVTAFDGDRVSAFNCGRQNFYPMDIGINKADVLINRLNMGFGTAWESVAGDFTPDHLSRLNRVRVLCTCIDKARVRFEIGDHYHGVATDTLWIDGGNDHHDGQAIIGHLGQPTGQSGLRLPNVFDLYQAQLVSQEDSDTVSCSHEDSIRKQDLGVNHQTALLMSQLLWQLLRHGELNTQGAFFNLQENEILPLSISPDVWQSFGVKVC